MPLILLRRRPLDKMKPAYPGENCIATDHRDYANKTLTSFITKMCAAMAASNKCDTKYSVYKDSIHVKEIAENPGSIGSPGEFCGAFYHVPQSRTLNRFCLDPENCNIATGKDAKEDSQPKTAVALVKFLLKDDTHFLKRYTNCYSNKTHAEEYFVNDVKANICSSFGELKEVTMYITMQPCHKSVSDTKGTKKDWSCCDILIDLAKNELKGVKIVIKPTHLSQAGWDKTEESNDPKLIANAEKGIMEMMRNGIELLPMNTSDWKELLELDERLVVEEKNKERRSSLDKDIGLKLGDWSRMAAKQASQKWSKESIRSNDAHLNISYDGEKVEWTGNFESLKDFVERNLKEEGKWTSSGNQHRFVSSDLCITWYFQSTTTKSKTLLLQGKDGDRLKKTLICICNQPVDRMRSKLDEMKLNS